MDLLYERIKQTVSSQFTPNITADERIDEITHLMRMEIRVVATNFANYARQNPGEDLSDQLNDFVDNHFEKILIGNLT